MHQLRHRETVVHDADAVAMNDKGEDEEVDKVVVDRDEVDGKNE
jgi:hypothetical protein